MPRPHASENPLARATTTPEDESVVNKYLNLGYVLPQLLPEKLRASVQRITIDRLLSPQNLEHEDNRIGQQIKSECNAGHWIYSFNTTQSRYAALLVINKLADGPNSIADPSLRDLYNALIIRLLPRIKESSLEQQLFRQFSIARPHVAHHYNGSANKYAPVEGLYLEDNMPGLFMKSVAQQMHTVIDEDGKKYREVVTEDDPYEEYRRILSNLPEQWDRWKQIPNIFKEKEIAFMLEQKAYDPPVERDAVYPYTMAIQNPQLRRKFMEQQIRTDNANFKFVIWRDPPMIEQAQKMIRRFRGNKEIVDYLENQIVDWVEKQHQEEEERVKQNRDPKREELLAEMR